MIEVVDQFRGVFEEFCRFPGKFDVTNPADKVFQNFADKFGVKDLFTLKFDVVIDDYWGWGRLCLSNDWGVAAGSTRDT